MGRVLLGILVIGALVGIFILQCAWAARKKGRTGSDGRDSSSPSRASPPQRPLTEWEEYDKRLDDLRHRRIDQ